MRAIIFLVSTLLLSSAHALELTAENWNEHITGKTFFIKFHTPADCEQCAEMKPAWDELMEEYKESPTLIVADFDCTQDESDNKDKCDELGVKKYPTIKYGDPEVLLDYQKGIGLDDLKKQANELEEMCTALNQDLCDAEQKNLIKQFTAMTPEERAALVVVKKENITKLEKDLKELMATLQKEYKEASEKRDQEVAEIKASGLGLLKAVHLYEKRKHGEIIFAESDPNETQVEEEADEEDPEGGGEDPKGKSEL